MFRGGGIYPLDVNVQKFVYKPLGKLLIKSVVLFPPPFCFVFDISNLLSYIQNISSNELARPVMGTIFLVVRTYVCHICPLTLSDPYNP